MGAEVGFRFGDPSAGYDAVALHAQHGTQQFAGNHFCVAIIERSRERYAVSSVR
jgi:hypothetical protein